MMHKDLEKEKIELKIVEHLFSNCFQITIKTKYIHSIVIFDQIANRNSIFKFTFITLLFNTIHYFE